MVHLVIGNIDGKHRGQALVDRYLTHGQTHIRWQHVRFIRPGPARADPHLVNDARVHNLGGQLQMPVGDRVEGPAIDCHALRRSFFVGVGVEFDVNSQSTPVCVPHRVSRPRSYSENPDEAPWIIVQPRPKHNHGHGCRPRHGLELRAIALHASELRLVVLCLWRPRSSCFFQRKHSLLEISQKHYR